MISAIVLLTTHLAATPAALAAAPIPGLTGDSSGPVLVAKGPSGKKKPAPSAAKGSVEVATDLSVVEVKEKGRRASAFVMKPNTQLQATVTGAGKLAVVIYQALTGDKATANVTVNVSLDGKAQAPTTFKGKKSKSVTLLGPGATAVSSPKSLTLVIGEGSHTIAISVPGVSTAAVVELQHYPKGAKSALPVSVVKGAPPAVAAAPGDTPVDKPVEPPPSPGQPPPPGPPPVEVAAQPVEPPAPVARSTEDLVKSGAIRDGLVGSYPEVVINDRQAQNSERFSRAAVDKPFQFVADGPGVVTVRVHRLGTPGGVGGTTEKLTITENDVLLQTVDIETAADERYSVEGVDALRVSGAREYRLTLGPKLAHFALQPPETASQGLAIRYVFEAQAKSTAMALSLDLGDEATGGSGAFGPTTVVTEVAVREKVVQVEKVVRVGGAGTEHMGIAVVVGAVLPTWGGVPAPSAGLDLQWVLPFADGRFALNGEALIQRHQLNGKGVDARQSQIASSSLVWILPAVRVGPTVRIKLNESLRLAAAVRGLFARVDAKSSSQGGAQSDTATVFGVAALASLEIRVGVGWWTLDAGYDFAPKVPLQGTLKDFDVGGFELGTRFRFVL